MKKKELNIWNYLHHLLLGIFALIIGIIGIIFTLFIEKDSYFEISLIISSISILVGLFLIIDDILAETIGKSLFNKISDQIRLKKYGILVFIIILSLFILFIFIRFL